MAQPGRQPASALSTNLKRDTRENVRPSEQQIQKRLLLVPPPPGQPAIKKIEGCTRSRVSLHRRKNAASAKRRSIPDLLHPIVKPPGNCRDKERRRRRLANCPQRRLPDIPIAVKHQQPRQPGPLRKKRGRRRLRSEQWPDRRAFLVRPLHALNSAGNIAAGLADKVRGQFAKLCNTRINIGFSWDAIKRSS